MNFHKHFTIKKKKITKRIEFQALKVLLSLRWFRFIKRKLVKQKSYESEYSMKKKKKNCLRTLKSDPFEKRKLFTLK